MTVLQNRIRSGGFLQSEADRFRSRDQVTIEGGSGGAGVMYAGTILGKITSTGKYVSSANTGSDGAQTSIAILYDDVDASHGDVVAGVIARDAEVRAEDLIYDASVTTLVEQEAKWAQLAVVGIIVRTMGGVQIAP